MLVNESDVLEAIRDDAWMMGIIQAAWKLELPDWWVSAGFVRSKIWDVQHGYAERTPLADIDVVYFDPDCTDEAAEKQYEQELRKLLPDIPWSVKNQARMHVVNNNPPYASAVDGISKFPETATALGVKILPEGKLTLTAPCGIEDVLRLQVKPCPYFAGRPDLWKVYERRIAAKNWKRLWPRLSFTHIGSAGFGEHSSSVHSDRS